MNFALRQFPYGDTTFLERAGFVSIEGDTFNVPINPELESELFFSPEATVRFKARTGNFNAPDVAFSHRGGLLDIAAGQNIFVGSVFGGNALSAGATYRSRGSTSTRSLLAGSIDVSADLSATAFVESASTIAVGGQLSAAQVTARGNVTANRIRVRNLDALTAAVAAGTGGITPFLGDLNGAATEHIFNVGSLSSAGGINFSGASSRNPVARAAASRSILPRGSPAGTEQL